MGCEKMKVYGIIVRKRIREGNKVQKYEESITKTERRSLGRRKKDRV